MSGRFLTLAACLGLAMSLLGHDPARAEDAFRVGSTPSSVPFTFLDTKTNKIEGVMSDVIAAVAKQAGFTIEAQAMSFSSLIPALTANKIDIVAAAMFATPARAEVVDFTDTVYSYGEGLFVPVGDEKAYKTLDELKGQIVGAQVGTIYLKELQASGKFAEVKAYDSVPDIMADVNAGRIKAGFGDYPIVAYQKSKGNFPRVRLMTSYEPSFKGSIALAVRKGNPEFLARLNKGVAAIKGDGELAAILKKWGL